MSLNSDLIPESYNILIKNDEKVCNFSGKCTIVGTIAKKTSELILHSQDLSFTSDPLVNDSPWNFTFFTPKGENEECGVRLTPKTSGASLNAGQPVTITIDFTGPIVDGMAGYYRVNYGVLGSDEPRLGAMTQFEAAYARRAFPCIDEPSAKATFALTLEVPATYSTVLANMPSERDETVNNDGTLYRRVKFGVTPRMSTYLLAWIVGEYDHVAAVTEGNGGVRFRVFTPQGAGKSGEFALRTGVLALDYLAEFFGHDFPLPKQDMIAVREFAAGAMENWGLITYRESALLADKETSSSESLGRVSYVVAHELAHQWFGNLVSPQWWTQLWLNEGFATIVSAVAVDELYPELRYTRNYVLTVELQEALKLDALVSTHPVEVVVEQAEDVEQIFDAISYCKGAAVLAMLFDRLGREVMRAGLKEYLAAHAYGNAVTEDLWRSLSKAADMDVGEEMGRWVTAPGYPMVHLRWDEATKSLHVRQQRFLSDRAAYAADGKATADDGIPWRFALHLTMPGGERHSLHVTERSHTFQLPARPVAANDGCRLLARVVYDHATMPLYSSPADIASLSPETKIALVSDAFALTGAGIQPPADLLRLALSLAGETEYCIARMLVLNLSDFLMSVVPRDDEASFAAASSLLCQVAQPMLDHHGWDRRQDDEAGADDVRSMAISALGCHEQGDAIATRCREMLTAWLDGDDAVASHAVLSACVRVVACHAKDEGTLEMLRRAFRAARTNEVEEFMLNNMTTCTDADLAEAQLRWLLASGDVRPNMMRNPIIRFAIANTGSPNVVPVLTKVWPLVVERLASNAHDVSVLLTSVAKTLNTQQDVTALLDLATRFPKPEALSRAVAQAKEKGEERVRMVEADRAAVLAFLATLAEEETTSSQPAKRTRR